MLTDEQLEKVWRESKILYAELSAPIVRKVKRKLKKEQGEIFES
jgi:hypothetical protein